MRTSLAAVAASVTLAAGAAVVGVAAPASAHADRDRINEMAQLDPVADSPIQSGNIDHLSTNPGQVAISGCFLYSAPVFVTSGVDSIQVWDVSDAAHPVLTGTLPQALFENEAMNCGERQTKNGIERFVLIGVDLVASAPADIQHTNVGGGELIVVDVTDPTAPTIRSRTPGTTSTHTVACVDVKNCTTAYSAGDSGDQTFSIFNLRNLDAPKEVDADTSAAGVQPFSSPTAAHKWNFDNAGYGTHTGFDGSSIWKIENPRKPKLITTTGKAGLGDDPKFEGYNDFIHHNSFHPNAKAFKPNSQPSLANGNILLVTEEDYEQTDCARAGSFQTWWIKRLDGTKNAIVPLDKVELADLGTFQPQYAFCSAHWFDYHPSGVVAIGFYGGGTHILDVRSPKNIKPYAHSVWGVSEVWDAMWVPVYKAGKQTGNKTNVVYSIDLVRGLDVYSVDLPGGAKGAAPDASVERRSMAQKAAAGAVPLGLVGGAMALALAMRRRKRITV